MPGHDDTRPPAGRDDRDPLPSLSRRSVLRGAAGAGVAGIAVTALAGTAGPAIAATARAARPAARGAAGAATDHDADTGEQVVVHVRDARSGEIDVFSGTSHTRVQDRELAARLVRASR
jgi:outer membrane lipoprotein SlyB